MNNMKKVVGSNVRKVYGPSQQQDVQSTAVRKINSLLSSGAVSVTGPIQPRILKHKTSDTTIHNNNPLVQHIHKCYICDEFPGSQPMILTQASTAVTNTKIPNKIGRVVGDAFMVIVSVDDVICKKCMTLFNQMDRIENDLEKIRNNILNSIYKKYGIDDDSKTSTQSPPAKMQKLNNSSTYINRKVVPNQSDDEPTRKIVVTKQVHHQIPIIRDTVENQLTNMFESPDRQINTTQIQSTTVTAVQPQQPIQKQRGPIKFYKCMTCEFKTTDLKQFQPHYEHCRQQNVSHVQTGFRCKICKKLFASVAALKQHQHEKHSDHITNATIKNIDLLDQSNTNTKSAQIISNQVYSCNMCQYKTPDKVNYDDHLRKHIKMKPFKCRICSMRFETREQAGLHAKSHQPDYFKCGSCSVSFPQRELLMKHFETHEKEKQQQTTQKLLQETIDEALRENTETMETKDISFFTCDICAVTFLRENFYNQHMISQHNKKGVQHTASSTALTTNQTTSSITTTSQHQQQQQHNSSLVRQDVRTDNKTIINTQQHQQQQQQQQQNSISDADLESIFEKMHSDKTDIDVTNNSADGNVSGVVITSQENAVGGITFNITIPQGEELTLNQEQKIIQQIQAEAAEAGNSQSSCPVTVSIDMPALEQNDDNSHNQEQQQPDEDDEHHQQQELQQDELTSGGLPVSMPSLDDEIDAQHQQQEQANTDQVPMDLEDVQNSVEDGQIKFILNDGQLLQLNNHIITDSDGNQILVQGTDSEQIQQLLQSVGVLQSGESLDGETLHMMDENNQMIIVQQGDSGEAQLIDASMLNADGQIVIQQQQQQHDDDNDNSQSANEDGTVQMQYTTEHTEAELQQLHEQQQEQEQEEQQQQQQEQHDEEEEVIGQEQSEHDHEQEQQQDQEQEQEQQLQEQQMEGVEGVEIKKDEELDSQSSDHQNVKIEQDQMLKEETSSQDSNFVEGQMEPIVTSSDATSTTTQ